MPETTQSVIRDNTPSPIEEPPLKNKKSCLNRALSLLSTLLILAVVFFCIVSIFFTGPTRQRLAQLPNHFPSDIPLYRFEDRVSIQFQSTKKDDKLFNRLAYVPKYLLAPALLKLNPNLPEEQKKLRNGVSLDEKISFSGLKTLLAPSFLPNTDTVEIDWENLEEAKKIYNFYKKNLPQADYQITTPTAANEDYFLIFKKDGVRGELQIISDKNNKAEKIFLKINLANPNPN
ncbi:MAG: hypothetical protein HY982_01225 [Candidatus Magasanikbacteria bacterium]|nr:hypothetical protein [Candidatus Magasanikbacteria bacterium]